MICLPALLLCVGARHGHRTTRWPADCKICTPVNCIVLALTQSSEPLLLRNQHSEPTSKTLIEHKALLCLGSYSAGEPPLCTTKMLLNMTLVQHRNLPTLSRSRIIRRNFPRAKAPVHKREPQMSLLSRKRKVRLARLLHNRLSLI